MARPVGHNPPVDIGILEPPKLVRVGIDVMRVQDQPNVDQQGRGEGRLPCEPRAGCHGPA